MSRNPDFHHDIIIINAISPELAASGTLLFLSVDLFSYEYSGIAVDLLHLASSYSC
jgi:hypothetical protein